MPEYEFQCNKCGEIMEHFASIDDCPQEIGCCVCAGQARKIISFQGGVQTDNPAWINDHLRAVLQRDGEKPIETRKEHNQYLKANGYVQRR